ncbi:hypothetical protein [Serratia rubidaea]|uniref:Uncharacterized protein n=1 Tax=Serratia rubidaea TaxID=61652 RepID=A0ABS0M9H0_SERRU|nr:hypothetical protein [Serratia rubidaea]MBH1929018.1 hypothetical protein [Serratia rubidaea]MDC6118849.1 hypothetical protein [Serratia rubidaea]
MKFIKYSVIQGLCAAKRYETVAGNYVKLQDGWDIIHSGHLEDGNARLCVRYALEFIDLAENKCYIAKENCWASTLSDGDVIMKHPFLHQNPDGAMTVLDLYYERDDLAPICGYIERPNG